MKQLFLFNFLISISITAFGQVYLQPNYANKSSQNIEIPKITISDKYTIVEFVYKNRYETGGYAHILPETVIRTNKGKKFKLQKVKGIPVAPYKHFFKRKGEILKFKLYFPPINPTTKYIDIIEIEGDSRAFNFYKIKLIPMA